MHKPNRKPRARKIQWRDSTRAPLICWAEYADRLLLTVRSDPSGHFVSTMKDKTNAAHVITTYHSTEIQARMALEGMARKVRLDQPSDMDAGRKTLASE